MKTYLIAYTLLFCGVFVLMYAGQSIHFDGVLVVQRPIAPALFLILGTWFMCHAYNEFKEEEELLEFAGNAILSENKALKDTIQEQEKELASVYEELESFKKTYYTHE